MRTFTCRNHALSVLQKRLLERPMPHRSLLTLATTRPEQQFLFSLVTRQLLALPSGEGKLLTTQKFQCHLEKSAKVRKNDPAL